MRTIFLILMCAVFSFGAFSNTTKDTVDFQCNDKKGGTTPYFFFNLSYNKVTQQITINDFYTEAGDVGKWKDWVEKISTTKSFPYTFENSDGLKFTSNDRGGQPDNAYRQYNVSYFEIFESSYDDFKFQDFINQTGEKKKVINADIGHIDTSCNCEFATYLTCSLK